MSVNHKTKKVWPKVIFSLFPGGASLSDEEFESVSQVSGPRRPVWQREDSDSKFTF